MISGGSSLKGIPFSVMMTSLFRTLATLLRCLLPGFISASESSSSYYCRIVSCLYRQGGTVPNPINNINDFPTHMNYEAFYKKLENYRMPTFEEYMEKPTIPAADELACYTVHVEVPAILWGAPEEEIKEWYSSFIPRVDDDNTPADKRPKITVVYSGGFTARLSANHVEAMEKERRPGFIRASRLSLGKLL